MRSTHWNDKAAIGGLALGDWALRLRWARHPVSCWVVRPRPLFSRKAAPSTGGGRCRCARFLGTGWAVTRLHDPGWDCFPKLGSTAFLRKTCSQSGLSSPSLRPPLPGDSSLSHLMLQTTILRLNLGEACAQSCSICLNLESQRHLRNQTLRDVIAGRLV